MKKNLLWIILLIAMTILTHFTYVRADSGWDSSYDSGSSWSSSDYGWSSSDYGRSSHSSGSSSSSDGIDLGFFIVFMLVIIFIGLANKGGAVKRTAPTRIVTPLPSTTVTDEDLKKYGIDKEQFKQMVYDKYVEIQKAWMNFEYDKLKELLTNELYNSYIMQLDALKLKNEQNIMSDFTLVDVRIIGLKEEYGILNVETYLNVTMYDYVVDKDKNVVRGDDKHKIDIKYTITFVRTAEEGEPVTKCPSCGAEIEGVTGGQCEYCRTLIVVDAKNFVMSKKTCVGQRKL